MNILQKAFYLGVGLISLVGEKTTSSLDQLRQQTLKLAEELVKRGELTTEEARRFVDEVMDQAKPDHPPTPRPIEILETTSEDEEIQRLKQTVKQLQTELADLNRSTNS